MVSMANNTLASLEAALDRAVDAAVDTQAAVNTARRRVGLSKAPKAFFTAAEMVAELCAAQDRHDAESRIETNALIRAAIADTLHKFDPGYRPDRFHAALIELASSFRDEAKRPKATTGNVVLMKSARGIIEAGRRRRDEA
jgi:hypothetical protein